MTKSQLVPVFTGNLPDSPQSEILLCDARELHAFLQVSSRFNDWIKNRIEEYRFVENQDFLVTKNLVTKNGRGGNRRSVEYHLTLDMAKELAMVERNEQGSAARRYFIECEKRLSEQATLPAKARMPALPKRIIRKREDLSFTRRDSKGLLLNWTPPADENGFYDWYEAYGIGEAWFAEVCELARNNPQEAYWSLRCAAPLISEYARNTKKEGMGHVEGFFDRMARFTLAGILDYPQGVRFPFIAYEFRGKTPHNGLTPYLKKSTPIEHDEWKWQAWIASEDCRRLCFEHHLSELIGQRR